MACSNCGHSSCEEDFDDELDDNPFLSDDSSSSDGEPYHPGLPPFLNFHDMLPHPFFPGNPLHFMLQLRQFQEEMGREQQRIRRDEETNRKRQLSSLQKTMFSEDLNERQCVICLDEFVEGTELKRLSCRHHYHVECIDRWLVQNGRCPLCNSKAVNTLEEVRSRRHEAKRLREKAHRSMRKRARRDVLREKRMEEIKKNPGNASGRKRETRKRKRKGAPGFVRRARTALFPLPFFGSFLPPVQPSYGGALDSEDEEEQIQAAIRESLRESEEMERREKEEKEKESKK